MRLNEPGKQSVLSCTSRIRAGLSGVTPSADRHTPNHIQRPLRMATLPPQVWSTGKGVAGGEGVRPLELVS